MSRLAESKDLHCWVSLTLSYFYRALSDVSRHLDDCRGRAQTCSDLFSPSVETQRVKLRQYCERLIFSDPLGHGRKGEELLWRKGYYDVVTTAKRLRKVCKNTWTCLLQLITFFNCMLICDVICFVMFFQNYPLYDIFTVAVNNYQGRNF